MTRLTLSEPSLLTERTSTRRHQPAVSVVVSAYNVEQWIEEALASVIDQTCGHEGIEIVFVDNGSTDATVARAGDALGRSPVAFKILIIENGGPSRARNWGWRHANADWIQFLDGDDLLHRQKLELQLRVASSLGPDVAVVYADWSRLGRVAGRQRQAQRHSPVIGADPVGELLQADNVIATGSQLFRRTWLERVSGFDERHWLVEDVDLMMRIAMEGGKFHHVCSTDPLFLYRERHGSLSQRSEGEFVEACLRNAGMAERFWQLGGDLTRKRRELLANIYLQGSRYYASRDAGRFEATTTQMELLVPGFVPRSPRRLKYASLILGYRRAEALAVRYRRLKAVVTRVAPASVLGFFANLHE